MSVSACAALVHRGDPDRFLSAMTAPPSARDSLFVLYAFNLEVAKAPWVTEETMIAEMRLQWWRDVLEEAQVGKIARAHEVAAPLSELIAKGGIDVAAVDQAIAARRWDIYKEPFEDAAHLDEYLTQTAGNLMWVAAQSLGAESDAREDIVQIGAAMGLANWLRAVPAYEARGRFPLVDGRADAVQALAQSVLSKLSAVKRSFGPALPAIHAGWQTRAILNQVVADPRRVADGTLGTSEFRKRGTLLWQSFTKR